MDFFEVVEIRRSIRTFQEKEIEEEKLKKILEAAKSAPSAGNLQAYKIAVIRKQEKRIALGKAAFNQESVGEAPVVLVFLQDPKESCRRYGRRGEELYSLQDATIACSYAQLAASNLGLGSCWVGAFDEEEVRIVIDAPSDLKPIALLPIGYPAESPPKREKKNLSQLLFP
jgi:nitroreductase